MIEWAVFFAALGGFHAGALFMLILLGPCARKIQRMMDELTKTNEKD